MKRFLFLFAVLATTATASAQQVHNYGWAGQAEAKAARQALAGDAPPLYQIPIGAEAGPVQDVKLWTFARFELGHHIPCRHQEIGDCVSHGTANALEYSLCAYLAAKGGTGEYRPCYAPYIYGISRVKIGGGRIRGDGSVGAWAAAGVSKYGVLASDESGVPPYSGSVAKSWGYYGPPEKWIQWASSFKAEARLVTTWAQAREALRNGYGIAVCSGVGFQNFGERNGRVEGSAGPSWAHCMAFTGICEQAGKEALYCQNSWGESAHAPASLYARLDRAPPGGFWVKKATAEKMLAQEDSYAYSFNGFAGQELFPIRKGKVNDARFRNGFGSVDGGTGLHPEPRGGWLLDLAKGGDGSFLRLGPPPVDGEYPDAGPLRLSTGDHRYDAGWLGRQPAGSGTTGGVGTIPGRN